MKQFLKVVIWIVVLGAIGFGIYSVLPEHPQAFVKGLIQPLIDTEAKIYIGKIQDMKNKDLNDATYKSILEANTGICAWVYDIGEDGARYVTFYGSGASVNLKDWDEYDGNLSTSCQVKVEFKIVGDAVTIIPYIDKKKMYLVDIQGNEGQYKESNKEIKKEIFRQLSSGMTTE